MRAATGMQWPGSLCEIATFPTPASGATVGAPGSGRTADGTAAGEVATGIRGSARRRIGVRLTGLPVESLSSTCRFACDPRLAARLPRARRGVIAVHPGDLRVAIGNDGDGRQSVNRHAVDEFPCEDSLHPRVCRGSGRRRLHHPIPGQFGEGDRDQCCGQKGPRPPRAAVTAARSVVRAGLKVSVNLPCLSPGPGCRHEANPIAIGGP